VKGPTVHPIKSQINLDHRWNESDKGTSKVPAVFGENPTGMELCPLHNPTHMHCTVYSPGCLHIEKMAISRLSYDDAVGTS